MGELLEVLNGLGEPVIFLGDGVPVFKDQIRERLTVPFSFAPAHVNRQRAAAVAALGARYFAEGKMESSDDYRPDYLRKSQAEREREEREAKEGGRNLWKTPSLSWRARRDRKRCGGGPGAGDCQLSEDPWTERLLWRRSSAPGMNPGSSPEAGGRSAVI